MAVQCVVAKDGKGQCVVAKDGKGMIRFASKRNEIGCCAQYLG
jgi:hypothetical protein